MRIRVVSNAAFRRSLVTGLTAGTTAAARVLFLLSACLSERLDFETGQVSGCGCGAADETGIDPVLDRVTCLCLEAAGDTVFSCPASSMLMLQTAGVRMQAAMPVAVYVDIAIRASVVVVVGWWSLMRMHTIT